MATIDNVTGTDGWKVRIDRVPYADCIKIYMYRPVMGGSYEVLEPDGWITRIAEGTASTDVKPVLSLNGFNAKAMLIALAEAISEEGIRTPDSHRLQGTLDAQAAHLEDLRMLLKLNKPRGDKK